jgi:hypothetical protein
MFGCKTLHHSCIPAYFELMRLLKSGSPRIAQLLNEILGLFVIGRFITIFTRPRMASWRKMTNLLVQLRIRITEHEIYKTIINPLKYKTLNTN